MYTRDEAHAVLDRWYDESNVGNLTFFRAPRAKHVWAVIEKVVKKREMSTEARDAFERFVGMFDAQKGEFYRDNEGNPDRVKFTRSY